MDVNNHRVRNLAFFFGFWMFLGALMHNPPFTVFASPEQALKLDQANFLAIPNTKFTPVIDQERLAKSEGWQNQALPDDWYRNHRDIENAWYQFEFDLNESTNSTAWGVYLPSVTHNVAVFINGTWVGQSGPFGRTVSRHGYEPLMYTFSGQLLKTGTNTMYVRLQTQVDQQGLMGEVFVAPAAVVQEGYDFKYFVRITMVKWFVVFFCVSSFVLFSIWLLRKQEVNYAYYAVTSFVWAIHTLDVFVNEPPFSAKNWEAMNFSLLVWAVVANTFLCHRFVGVQPKNVERLLLIIATCSLSLFFLPDAKMVLVWGGNLWLNVCAIMGTYTICYLAFSYWKDPRPDIGLLIFVGTPILVASSHDLLMFNDLGDRRDGLLIQYGLMPSFVLYCWFVFWRFIQSLNEAEEFTTLLEQRLKDRENELRDQFQQVKTLEDQKLLMQERERIMRDMHDGIGGQLVSLMASFNSPGKLFRQAREALRDSINDLRLVIDSLDPTLQDTSTLLGMMRVRMMDQLEIAGITLDWQVTDLPRLKDFSPEKTLHIMRIIQESIANCIKHSETDRLTLSTKVDSYLDVECIFIMISDYGKGLEAGAMMGRGIENMHYRAGHIKAHFHLVANSGGRGTMARLVLPLEGGLPLRDLPIDEVETKVEC
ncbi:MAG: hypothetical protein KUG82_09845 [Pseudomonadales bacterium]|nr:hypothetical protein [Pseudomonadales bacterium]